MKKYTYLVLTCCISAAILVAPLKALAVGGGLPFGVNEGMVANNNGFVADSLDFTYHACTDITDPLFDLKSLVETGYFWISSYQDAAGVVDSQINHFLANGYHIYGIYTYEADQVPPAPQQTPSGDRLNYVVDVLENASIQLFVDPLQNTVLGIAMCQNVIAGNGDDVLLGESNMLIQGEKSETNGLANGDFKVIFDNWMWGPAAAMVIPIGGLNLADYNVLVFNGNITGLGGPLRDDHNPEGSGNLFWLESFD